MAKVQIKSEKLTPFGGIFSIMEKFDSMLSPVIDSTLGQRCSSIFGYQFSEIVRSLMSVYFCGGSCVEDVTSQLMRHLSYHPTLRTCSSDTILRAIKELTQENISYTSDQGKTYDFNTADKLNTLLINALVSTGELKEIEEYDVDFDHQFLETEKYDAKPTYKKFLGYRPGVYVIGDKIVYIENSDGNTNVRFHQADTHKRFFALLESQNIRVNRFRADCGSCSKEIVSEIEKHCKHFYIRANRCSSLYNTTDDSKPVFPLGEKKDIYLDVHTLGMVLGISNKLGFHASRHTFGVLMLNEDIPIGSIARMMGHADITSTQVYAQVTEQKISNDMDKLIAKRERNRLSNEKTIGK